MRENRSVSLLLLVTKEFAMTCLVNLGVLTLMAFLLLVTNTQSSLAQGTQWTYYRTSGNGLLWKGVEPDGSVRWGWDDTGDGHIEKWGLDLDGDNRLEVFWWTPDRDNSVRGWAWASNGQWLESVWDFNRDNFYEHWVSYTGSSCNLVMMRKRVQTAYNAYLQAQMGRDALSTKRAYHQYQFADLTFKACKARP